MAIIDQVLGKVEALKKKAILRNKSDVDNKMFWRGIYDACKEMQASPETILPEQLRAKGEAHLKARIVAYKHGRHNACIEIAQICEKLLKIEALDNT